MRTRSRSTSPHLTTPAKSQLIFPQVTFQPLPVLQEGEGLEEEEIGNDSAQSVTVNLFMDISAKSQEKENKQKQ